MKLLQFILLSFSLIVVAGCEGDDHNNMEKPTDIKLSLGEPFDVFFERYPAIKKQHHAGPEGGANFYQFSWVEDKPAEIKVKFDSNGVTINNAISLMVTEFVYKNNEGITSVSIKSGITHDKKINHNEARLMFHEFLQSFLGKGWKRSLIKGYPRLSGTQAMHYMREKSSVYPLDPTYLPTIKEWMSIKELGTHWALHLDSKAFMSIVLQRKTSKENNDEGIYLLTIEIYTPKEEFFKNIYHDKKKSWKDEWYTESKRQEGIRIQKEKDLLAKGYKIDESYEDYEINPKK